MAPTEQAYLELRRASDLARRSGDMEAAVRLYAQAEDMWRAIRLARRGVQ